MHRAPFSAIAPAPIQPDFAKARPSLQASERPFTTRGPQLHILTLFSNDLRIDTDESGARRSRLLTAAKNWTSGFLHDGPTELKLYKRMIFHALKRIGLQPTLRKL